MTVLEERQKSKRKPDLSKLENNVALESNVMNFTVGELISKDPIFEAEQEIEDLENQLETLERQKEERLAEELERQQ